MKMIKIATIAASTIFAFHCVSTGGYRPSNITTVQLNKKNFKVIATGISGEAESEYILGFVVPGPGATSAVAVAQVGGSKQVRHEALSKLWASFKEEHGDPVGRNLGLVNLNYDATGSNWFGFYAQEKMVISADVVEFTE